MNPVCIPDSFDICFQCLTIVPQGITRACPTFLGTQPPPRVRLGSKIARVLQRVGIKKTPGCGCGAREIKINGWDDAVRSWIKLVISLVTPSPKAKARKRLLPSPPQEKDRTAAKEAYRIQLLAQQKS